MSVGYTGDNSNGLKEASEKAEYETELRMKYLRQKYGTLGAEERLNYERLRRQQQNG